MLPKNRLGSTVLRDDFASSLERHPGGLYVRGR